ncbi:MAG: hypothetical protein IKY65_03520 [Rikenellaceae bacterium]|nr:hypothetical protein [Rikenellaceae bacterium]
MKNHIDEVLYSISPDTIVGRRYNPILGIVITLAAAAAMFGANYIEPFASNRDMFQYLMMGGFLVLATGATMICYWLFGDSVHPYYKPTNERLVRTDMIFNVADINRVETLVAAGDFKTLESLPRGTASGLIVVVYATKSGKFAMAQTLEYVPHEYQPVSEPHLFEEGKFTVADFM